MVQSQSVPVWFHYPPVALRLSLFVGLMGDGQTGQIADDIKGTLEELLLVVLNLCPDIEGATELGVISGASSSPGEEVGFLHDVS